MFTGIIEATGTVAQLKLAADGGRLKVCAPKVATQLAIANSIAVSGCCLTVVAKDKESFTADLSGETLRKTAFGEMKPGAMVNLERPMTAGKEFGGHFVQGHVDGVGRVTWLAPEGENWWLSVRVAEEMWRYVAMKGSISIDGISLTVAGWRDGVLDVAIIPYTYANTNVRTLKPGDPVNVECDMLAKYLERLLEARGSAATPRLTIEELKAQGF